MTYFSTDIGAQIHDINADDYYLYQDKSLHSALVVEKREELCTLDTETLEGEWERTFHTTHYLLKLKEQALKGTLKTSNFRSAAWQVFLDVLPGDLRQWVTVATDNRHKYSELKLQYVVDPHQNDDMSLTVNNPLSQEEKSPWAQFFQDNELRRLIMQDIRRTYPGELMFEQQEIRDLMSNILFIYAREQPDIDYKQGMHELLAPLVYVFYNEYVLVQDVTSPSSQSIRNVLSKEHLEHDVYWCYVALMNRTGPYYKTDKLTKAEEGPTREETVLFKESASQPSTYIVQSLEELQNVTLRRFDPELQQHLHKLAIQPQLYGLRWMRLLFGREFPLKDMLSLWDALFASPDFVGMVEYTCISMLLYIRDALLCNDHTGCLTLLMRYPETHDVHLFVQRSLFLRNPSHYECPPNLQYRPNNRTRLANGPDKQTRSGSMSRYEGQLSSSYRSEGPTTMPPKSPVVAITETIKRKISIPKPPIFTPATSVSADNTELAERKRVQEYCSTRLDLLLQDLQSTICDLCEEQTVHEDKLMVSLAGLKQVRDVLKGNVGLGCILAPESETPSLVSFESREAHTTGEQEDTSSQGTTSRGSSSVPAPPLPPADLETLDLFNDLSICSSKTLKRTQSSTKREEQEQGPKSKDFFDPLSSALSQDEEEFSEFLKKR